MNFLLKRLVITLVLTALCQAQAPPAPATVDEMQYLRFMLLNLASLDHGRDAVETFEQGITKQFGLDNQELAQIRAAANELNALLKQLRQDSQAIVSGRRALTQSDSKAISDMAAQREQTIESLANRVLTEVRSATANRLKAPGRILASKARRP